MGEPKTLAPDEIRRRIRVLDDYIGSFYRIREDSDAAWEALGRAEAARDKLSKMLKAAEDA